MACSHVILHALINRRGRGSLRIHAIDMHDGIHACTSSGSGGAHLVHAMEKPSESGQVILHRYRLCDFSTELLFFFVFFL